MLRSALYIALAAIAVVSLRAVAAPPSSAEAVPVAEIVAQRAQVKGISSAALSNDGRQLAWLVTDQAGTSVELAAADGRDARTVKIPDGCNAVDLRWARGVDEIAVLTRCPVDPSNTKPVHGAIWVLNTSNTTAAPRKLASVVGVADGLQWVKDGSRIAFLYVPGATRLPEATASGNPRVGVIGETNVPVQRVAEVTVADGAVTMLTPSDLYVYEFDLSAAGHRIAYIAAPPPGDDNWWTASLYVQAARPGSAPQVLVDPQADGGSLHGMQIAVPRWSPDGTKIAFIGGLMSDQGTTGGDIYVVPSRAGAAVNVTPGTQVSPSWLEFTGPNSILVTQISGGRAQVATYALRGLQPARVHVDFTARGEIGDGDELSLSIAHVSPLRIAYVEDSFVQPPEVHAGVLGADPPPAVSKANIGLARTWGKVRSLEWHSGPFLVQGWLMYPAHFDAYKTYPMIVYVHGGPTEAIMPNWGAALWGVEPTALSEAGYFVLMPNPRGSFGEGEAYVRAIRNQMGYGDLDDILAGVDAAEAVAPIDDRRLGMTGWSYGGFMSMFAPTQTDRFKAVAPGAGISDWQSYYGENQIDKWMIPFFGASLYDDPAAYARSSAITFIKHARTPALIVVGERDEECPASQSFEYWHALRTAGVATTLVVYPDEGHFIAEAAHQRDIVRRTLAWFAAYLAPPG